MINKWGFLYQRNPTMAKKRKMEKIFMFGILILLVGMFGIVSAVETSYCCEKLQGSNVMCQNAPQSQCDTNFKAVPTSCEATSYCKLATCIDAQQGDCIENSPLSACNAIKGGVWKDAPASEIPQCKLGCALFGDQAAFVTQTRANKLAALYGLEINFRQDIQNEIECLATANSAIEGACVFEKEGLTTCKRLNQKECNEMKTNSENLNVMFYENYLCSAVALGTDCARSEKTTCVPNKDEVYFVDTCGNLANIYDSNKQDDSLYWERIVTKDKSCGQEISNAIDSQCGNCNYLLGSVCSEYKRGAEVVAPEFGDYYCKDLSCEYDIDGNGDISKEEKFEHGESICLTTFPSNIKDAIPDDTTTDNIKNKMTTLGTSIIEFDSASGFVKGFGIKENSYFTEKEYNPALNEKLETENLPGSRYYRMICSYGEMIPEPCADFRQEICIQSNLLQEELGGNLKLSDGIWSNAKCLVNRWQDCAQQAKAKDCNDIEKRDCIWYDDQGLSKCVPLYAPGLKFWDDEGGEAVTVCAQASNSCTITYEKNQAKGLFSGERILRSTCGEGRKEGSIDPWKDGVRMHAGLIGDCGRKYNYLGFLGSSTNGGVERKTGAWN